MECYADKSKLLLALLILVLMIGVCAFCTTIPGLLIQIGGWIGIAFFGFFLLICIQRLFQNEPLLIIDDKKIEDRRAGWRVPWSAVEAVWVVQENLCIIVEDPTKYQAQPSGPAVWIRQQSARLDAAFGFPEIMISFQELDPGYEEVLAYIEDIKPGLVVRQVVRGE